MKNKINKTLKLFKQFGFKFSLKYLYYKVTHNDDKYFSTPPNPRCKANIVIFFLSLSSVISNSPFVKALSSIAIANDTYIDTAGALYTCPAIIDIRVIIPIT